MTHETMNHHAAGHDYHDIVAADEARASPGMQVLTGLGGLLALLGIGLVVLLVVLWKAP